MTSSSQLFALAGYDFDLPPGLIAQHPATRRDGSRLLRFQPDKGQITDLAFVDLVGLLAEGDLLVVNDTKVFPARLHGHKESGGKVELLLLAYPTLPPQAITGRDGWFRVPALGLVKSSKRPKPGARLVFAEDLVAEVVALRPDGKVEVNLFYRGGLVALLERQGQVPLPPYIQRQHGEEPGDRQRYQTIYAHQVGAVAAPTAGLHFSEDIWARLAAKGVATATVTLHVGYGTFAPVRVNDIRDHQIHSEFLTVSAKTAEQVNATRQRGGRVWAVGTTTVRALEFAADNDGLLREREGECALYIYPGYRFKVVENLITNFHLPQSSLLFLVAALLGRENVLRCYHHAIAHGYRFFSYGDAMVIDRG